MAVRIGAELATLEPVMLAVLKGGMVTAVELLKRFRFPCELDYVHVARYGNATKGGELTWIREPSDVLVGRHVLLVDDILDEGVTIAALRARLDALGVAKIFTAVLVSKDSPSRDVPVDFVGLRMGDGYVFGCGMDYQGQWRGLSEIRVIED
jgi:hypoxanthine phosphoribosyltransferase